MKRIKLFMAIILSIVVLSFGCDDHSHDHSDHFSPEGWVFIDGTGKRFMTKVMGNFQTGSETKFTVPLGDHTDHIKIKFLDKDRKEIDPPSSKEYSLKWEIADETIVELERHDGEEYEFHLEGLKEGTTTIQFHLMHAGHSDARSGLIDVEVVKND